jgi:hypothetical protein
MSQAFLFDFFGWVGNGSETCGVVGFSCCDEPCWDSSIICFYPSFLKIAYKASQRPALVAAGRTAERRPNGKG